MHDDPLSPRNVACAFAVFGLGTMMIAPEPNWSTVGTGLFCLVAFGTLSLVPTRRSALRRSGSGKVRHRVAQAVEIPAPPPILALEAPAPRDLNAPHPAGFRGTRTRRGGSRG